MPSSELTVFPWVSWVFSPRAGRAAPRAGLKHVEQASLSLFCNVMAPSEDFGLLPHSAPVFSSQFLYREHGGDFTCLPWSAYHIWELFPRKALGAGDSALKHEDLRPTRTLMC